jgi:small subunit ribosomal protein S15
MARMHSNGRGSSGSTRPSAPTNPRWLDYTEEEVTEIVTDLAKDGMSPSKIGMKLRDQYGVPSVKQATGKNITTIMEEEGLKNQIPEDLSSLLQKTERLKQHLDQNENDRQAKSELESVETKIRRLASYYRENNRIPQDWEYES